MFVEIFKLIQSKLTYGDKNIHELQEKIGVDKLKKIIEKL